MMKKSPCPTQQAPDEFGSAWNFRIQRKVEKFVDFGEIYCSEVPSVNRTGQL